MTTPRLHLTWAAPEAAVDVLAAQAPRNCQAVCGMDRAGQVLAWVDATAGQMVQSVMKVTPGTAVLMPWQDAPACRREFLSGFDD